MAFYHEFFLNKVDNLFEVVMIDEEVLEAMT